MNNNFFLKLVPKLYSEILATVCVQENTLKDILGVVELPFNGSHMRGKKVVTFEWLRAVSLKPDSKSQLCELGNNSTFLIRQCEKNLSNLHRTVWQRQGIRV